MAGLTSVPFALQQTQPVPTVAHLCHTLQEALGGGEGARIVAFTAPQASHAPGRIALETAYVAATQLGLRVLFVDTDTSPRPEREALHNAVRVPLLTAIRTGGVLSNSMAEIAGTRLFYMRLGKPGENGMTAVDLDTFSDCLQKLRAFYDLVFIEAPSILDGAFGVSIVKLADGGVMVLEAEKTRAPVAFQAKKTVESSGGLIVGAVLNNRRHFIPRWIYRML
jgi:Mrp family chromosome partitioning ATPase